MGEFKIDGRNIAITHYPEYAVGLAATGKYDVVFSGHNHAPEEHIRKINGKTYVVVGELAGFKGKNFYAIYDTKTNKVEIKNL